MNRKFFLPFLFFSIQTKLNMSNSNEQEKGFAVPALPKKQDAAEEPPAKPSLPPIPKLNYDKPSWGDVASFPYRLEVLKNGQSVETIQGPKKDFVTIGRLPICDILMEHPVSDFIW
jgi:hypothetical protein